MQTDKEIVKKRFGNKLSTYHHEAQVQKQIAFKLASLFFETHDDSINRVLEIGCGTGFLTKQILTKGSINELFLNDIADSAFEETQKVLTKLNFKNYQFLTGDAEHIAFPTNIDVVFSSSCFHWFNDLQCFFRNMHEILNSNGYFVFSSYGEENFKEIKETLNIGLTYSSLQEQIDLLSPDFEIIHGEEWTEVIPFANPKEVLKHIKQTGVNALQKGFFGKERLQTFNDKYLSHFSNVDGSVNLTYHPLIIIARKK